MLVTTNHIFHKKGKRYYIYGRVHNARDFRGWKNNLLEGGRKKIGMYVLQKINIREEGREKLVCSITVHENKNL